jgi:hypothetical protein
MQQDDEELQLLDTVYVDSVVKHKAGLQPMAMLSGGTKGSTVKIKRRTTRRTTRRQGTLKRPAPSTPKPDYQARKPKPAPKDKYHSEAPPPKQYENDHDHYKQEPSSGPEQEGYSDPGHHQEAYGRQQDSDYPRSSGVVLNEETDLFIDSNVTEGELECSHHAVQSFPQAAGRMAALRMLLEVWGNNMSTELELSCSVRVYVFVAHM